MTAVRDALRSLRKSPGFAALTVSMLALGIGASTGVFSVANAVLLRPLPYPEPDRLVQLQFHTPRTLSRILSIPEFVAFRAEDQILEHVAAYDFGGPGINLTGTDAPEQVKGIHVSADYFRLFGAQFALGREFSAEEDRPGGDKVVVLSDHLWRLRFAADATIVGKTIR